MDRLDRLNRRFPGREGAIRRRMSNDPSFREMCQDFEDASAALDYWRSAPQRAAGRASEYRDLVSELETEIEAALRR